MRKKAREGKFDEIPAEFVNKLKEQFKKKEPVKQNESL